MSLFSAGSPTRLSYALLGLATLFLAGAFVVGDSLAPSGRRLAKVAGDDPPMYFDVSHALLFHQSYDLTPEFRHIKPESDLWAPVSPVTGKQTSPFAIGYSVLAMPFLAAGTVIDAVTGNPADGYSRYAILFYCLTNVVLTGIGLIFLFTFVYRVAISWEGVTPAQANVAALSTVAAVFLGTSVGYYAFSEMSHAATFFSGTAFLMWWWKVRDREDIRSWGILGLLGGLVFLSRWQDVFFTAAPLLYDLSAGGPAILRRIRSRIVYGLGIGLCTVPQMLEWKFMFGKYVTVPQGSSIFSFPPPYIPNVLFSSEHGWFSWTPIALLGIAGLIAGSVRRPRLFLPWLAVIALEVGLIGSISVWHSGPGFGNRYMTSSAPILGLGLIFLLALGTRPTRLAVTAIGALCCLYSVVFAVQFRLDLVPKLDRLTASELLSDKLRIPAVRRQKQAADKADQLIDAGTPAAAIQLLQPVATPPDRDVLAALRKAYKAMGREDEARDAEKQLSNLMETRLF